VSSRIAPAPPGRLQFGAEQHVPGAVPLYALPDWLATAPWLVHGITDRAADMSLFGAAPASAVLPRWRALRDALGCHVIVHARQVHGASVLVHSALPAGIVIADDADGHATSRPGQLLAVSVADCVPIFVAAPGVRAVALLHGGWRGIAAGILEQGIATLAREFGATTSRLRIYLGPAICGKCYEVGPEVPHRLGLAADVTHVDLRAVLAHRAIEHGVLPANVTISTSCTRCGGMPFFSHRGGFAERQIAVLGIPSTDRSTAAP
jgi:polyphenol oxidase